MKELTTTQRRTAAYAGALLLACMMLFALVGCGKTLNGTYALATNHTIDFNSDGTCVMTDNSVSWAGTYKYDSSKGGYVVTINAYAGTVEVYVFKEQGSDLVRNNGSSDLVYKKM